jgi:ferredoxin-NADP reductase/predicted pyridoxine 5'-phosphate oxidase superfamily flavin-nucleotide-binding protein
MVRADRGWDQPTSPFHPGEIAVQERVGVRASTERLGRRMIRPYMPDQHRAFYASLPFVVVGSVDRQGRPWASLLSGPPGFLSSPDDTHLVLDAAAPEGDPLRDAQPGDALGLLGIQLSTRRRNRLNGRVSSRVGDRVTLEVDTAFGNCPQYIQTRALQTVAHDPGPVEVRSELDDEARALIAGADTFFVATTTEGIEGRTGGADVSHRGGRPGFVRLEGNTLTIPDYSGNNQFATLGNMAIHPVAGLLFVDFETGDLLQLTGTTTLDFDPPAHFDGARRTWSVTVTEVRWLRRATPLRWAFREASPNTLLTGTWAEAAERTEAAALRDTWRAFHVVRTVDESRTVRSLYLEPADGRALVRPEAGQHLPIRLDVDGERLVRTYTLSSAPHDPVYRISVKRDGRASNALHALRPGDRLEAMAPRGGFTLDAAETRPAVLLAVGVTPMIAMARHVAAEALATRHARPLTVFHAARTADQRAFHDAFEDLERAGMLRYVTALSREGGAHVRGRFARHHLQQVLPLDDYDVYLCGPSAFVADLYRALRDLGVADDRIHVEAFGPSSLQRDRPAVGVDEAVVTFADAGFEQGWDGTEPDLLTFAESHGLQPAYGCRGGSCGSCAVRVADGAVAYRTPPTAEVAPGEALICCAVPATPEVTLGL